MRAVVRRGRELVVDTVADPVPAGHHRGVVRRAVQETLHPIELDGVVDRAEERVTVEGDRGGADLVAHLVHAEMV